MFAVSAWAAPASAPATQRAIPTTQQIRQVVQQLNHPSPSKRRAAVRQLAEWGPLAFTELKRAAEGTNLEVALSAKDLLKELESTILLGAQVRLEFNRERIRWNEPCSLTVVVRNPSTVDIRVPWAAPTSRPAEEKLGDAEQVARMMDVGDFLVMTSPAGQTIGMRVEPIERDPEVYQVVDLRARGNPPTSVIAPGRQTRLVIPDFNRGWARYPMLASGKYTVAFVHQPHWKDESWTQSGFGAVKAPPVGIEIERAAPKEVLESTTQLEIKIKPGGDMLYAELVNTWDIPQWFNLNFGGPPTTHAKIEWSIMASRQDNAEPIELRVEERETKFEASKLVRLDSAERKVIGQIRLSQVKARIKEAVGDRPVVFALRGRYVHLLTTGELRDELRQQGNNADVPVHLFSGAISSEDIPVEPDKKGDESN